MNERCLTRLLAQNKQELRYHGADRINGRGEKLAQLVPGVVADLGSVRHVPEWRKDFCPKIFSDWAMASRKTA